MTFWNRLKSLMKEGETEAEFARRAGVKNQRIREWRITDGNQWPRLQMVESIAEHLNVNPGWLAFGSCPKDMHFDELLEGSNGKDSINL